MTLQGWHAVKPINQSINQSNSRKEEVVLSRLIIGHTYFSHSYNFRQEDPPECTACQEIYSVRHVLIDCIDLGLIRPRYILFRT